jgi:hypothetical protein
MKESECDSEGRRIFEFLSLSDCVLEINSLFIEASNHLFKLFFDELINANLYNKYSKQTSKNLVEIFSFHLKKRLGSFTIFNDFDKFFEKKKEKSFTLLTIYERYQLLDTFEMDTIDEFDFFQKRIQRIQSVWGSLYHLMSCYKKKKRNSSIKKHTRKLEKKFLRAYSTNQVDTSLHIFFYHLPLMQLKFFNF